MGSLTAAGVIPEVEVGREGGQDVGSARNTRARCSRRRIPVSLGEIGALLRRERLW